MRVPIKKMNLLVRIITFNWPTAITIAPFGVYIKEKHYTDHRLMRHEAVHWYQQMEMRVLPFYVWYLFEWIIKIFKYGKKAYKNISFEREARAHQNEIGYLDKRKSHAWYGFVSK